MKKNISNRIVCNSIPKSGTFLLSRVLTLLGYQNVADNRPISQRILNRLSLGNPACLIHDVVMRHWERKFYSYTNPSNNQKLLPIGVTSPELVPEELVRKWLLKVPYGMQMVGHVPYSHSFDVILQEHDYKHLVIIRNPKDVLVSFLHYVVKPGHVFRKDFMRLSEEERLSLAFYGGYAPLCDRNIIGLDNAFQSVLEWKQSQNCLIVKFEDLVGEKGGGTFQRQYDIVKKIIDYLGIDSNESSVIQVCKQAFSRESRTFRNGQIGSGVKQLNEMWLQNLVKGRSNLLKEFYGEC